MRIPLMKSNLGLPRWGEHAGALGTNAGLPLQNIQIHTQPKQYEQNSAQRDTVPTENLEPVFGEVAYKKANG